MANSTISASVRYLSDGASCAWPIPFPYGAPSDIGVSVEADGASRTLEYGKDYLVKDNCVMAVVPQGAAISIWLAIAPEAAITGARARAMNDAAQSSMQAAGPVYLSDAPVDPSVEETVADGLARLRQMANEMTVLFTQMLNAEASRLLGENRAAIETAQNSALASITRAASDKAADIRKRGSESANVIYGIERDALSALDNTGRGYAESMAKEAMAARASLDEARHIAAGIDANARELAGLSGNAARLVDRAGQDAANAKDAARNAWAAAWQASTMANRPGIGAIGKMAELDKCGSGMFIINGRIVHTPTMFFGLWPTGCPCCAAWDGFFVIAPQFPDDPKLPPYPADSGNGASAANPGNPASVGNGGWGACIHHKGLFEEGNETGEDNGNE